MLTDKEKQKLGDYVLDTLWHAIIPPYFKMTQDQDIKKIKIMLMALMLEHDITAQRLQEMEDRLDKE